jgi:hypothetical protein
MSKQDRQGVRTAVDLERKYNLGSIDKRFSDLMGVAFETRDSVDHVESQLSDELEEQVTSLTRNTERIIMAALESYMKTSDHEEFAQTVQSELTVLAEQISMNFTTTTEQVTNINGDLQTVVEELQKHFEFSADGLTIKAGENSMTLVLDNDMIKFVQNGEQFGWWDGIDFHTGNVVVELNERMQIGNFAFVPRSDGSLAFLKVR